MMDALETLCQWLRDNSSGIYKPAADAAEALEHMDRTIQVLRAERDRARSSLDNAVRMLTGIHALLYPPRFTEHDGRTWEFRDPGDPHKMLQELSERVRGIPDQLSTQTE